MKIEGPNGTVAEVDSLGRLYTLSTALTVDQFLLSGGRVSSMVFETVRADAIGSYIFYLKNEGTTNVAIGHISFMASQATTLWIDYVSGTPTYVTGTDVEITNRRLGNPTVPQVTAKYDTNITGLTQEGKLFFERLDTANKRYFLDTVSGISIPTGQALAIRSNNDLSDITMNASIGIVLL